MGIRPTFTDSIEVEEETIGGSDGQESTQNTTGGTVHFVGKGGEVDVYGGFNSEQTEEERTDGRDER